MLEFAEIVKQSGLYKGGAIRLIACESGAEGAVTAQGFSDAMGVKVIAPVDIVYVNNIGEMSVGDSKLTSPQGWRIFEPRKR